MKNLQMAGEKEDFANNCGMSGRVSVRAVNSGCAGSNPATTAIFLMSSDSWCHPTDLRTIFRIIVNRDVVVGDTTTLK